MPNYMKLFATISFVAFAMMGAVRADFANETLCEGEKLPDSWFCSGNVSVKPSPEIGTFIRVQSTESAPIAAMRRRIDLKLNGTAFIVKFDWRKSDDHSAGNVFSLSNKNTTAAYLSITAEGRKNQFQLLDLVRFPEHFVHQFRGN